MLKADAITFFGSKTKLANAAGVRLASVAAWGILVPEGRAMRLSGLVISGCIVKLLTEKASRA